MAVVLETRCDAPPQLRLKEEPVSATTTSSEQQLSVEQLMYSLESSARTHSRQQRARQLDPLRRPERSSSKINPYTEKQVARSWCNKQLPVSQRPIRPRVDWCSQHHVLHSKDNRRLPPLQRTYFDDIPYVRDNANHVLPAHHSLNFDNFTSNPTHIQCKELQQRFARYPFVEAQRQRREDLSVTVSTAYDGVYRSGASTNDADSDLGSDLPDDEAMLLAEEATRTSIYVSCTDDDGPPSFQSTHRHRSPSSASTHSDVVGITGEPLVERTNSSQSDLSPGMPPVMARRLSSKNSLIVPGSTGACGGRGPSNRRTSVRARMTNLTQWSIKFGGLVKLWRCIDVHSNMRISQVQFSRSLLDLGYPGDVKELFHSLNHDRTGTLLFIHFAPEAAQRIAELLRWIRSRYESMTGFLTASGDPHVNKQQLIHSLKRCGYAEEAGIKDLFDIMVKNGDATISMAETRNLDKWDYPEWLVAAADEIAAEQFKEVLLEKYHENSLLVWRQFDRQGTLRVCWPDFRNACKKIFPPEEQDAWDLPSIWRALDDDLSGWLSLWEYDPLIADDLVKLCLHVQSAHSSFPAAFPKMQPTTEYTITQGEFRHQFKPSGVPDSSLNRIFGGADADSSGGIGFSELRFLDTWRYVCQEHKAASTASPSSPRKRKLSTWNAGQSLHTSPPSSAQSSPVARATAPLFRGSIIPPAPLSPTADGIIDAQSEGELAGEATTTTKTTKATTPACSTTADAATTTATATTASTSASATPTTAAAAAAADAEAAALAMITTSISPPSSPQRGFRRRNTFF